MKLGLHLGYSGAKLDLPVALLAVQRAGGAFVPLDPSYPSERLSFMVEDADLAVVLCQKHLLSKLPPHRTRVVVLEEEIADGEGGLPQPAADQLAYLIYTSGSTGMPKGVLVTHANFFHSTAARFVTSEKVG